MALYTLHALISGHVQGVYFRQYTYNRATDLKLTGWVKNLPDGRVELMASGDETQVKLLLSWLYDGSPLATVKAIDWKAVDPPQMFSIFEIKR